MNEDTRRPAPDRVLRERFTFEFFEEWPHELFRAIESFAVEFGLHPNIMSAGTEVYRKIDYFVQTDLENVVNDAGEHPGDDDVVELAGFTTEDCSVEFTISEVTPFPSFLLIYDGDPTFDGEPEPIEDGAAVCAVRYEVA